MTAKEFLQDIYKKRQALETTQNKIEQLRVSAEGVGAIRYDKDRVQTSPEDHMSEAVAQMVELENEYEHMILAYHKSIILRTKMIDGMDDPRYVRLLMLRYVDCLRFEEIACRMAYSWQHVLRLHGEALDAFARQYEGQY